MRINILISDITSFNESIYKNEWDTLDLKKLSAVTDHMKTSSSALAVRMREDINNSYRLEWQDLKSCITTCLCSNETCNETPSQTNNKSTDSATSSTSTSNTDYKDDKIEVLLKSKFDFLKEWDIRSLSKKQPTAAEEPVTDNKPNEAPPSSSERKPKKVETTTESKPKKTTPVAESKLKKEKTSPEGKSK